MNQQPTTYEHSLTVRDNIIKYRKWKVKDRKKFIKMLSDIENIKEQEASNVLVYDCLENPKVILSPEEYRYVLTQIRKTSIGGDIDFKFTCSACKSPFNVKLDLDYIVKPKFSEYLNIKVDEIKIELGDVISKEHYDKRISDCKSEEDIYLTDFLYHIKSINGNNTFTFDELSNYFDNLDTDDVDNIFDEWDTMRFIVDDLAEVECPKCGHKENYIFDDLPGFFPTKWFNR